MTTTIEICNLAIAHCGASQFIASLDEASNEARLCALHLPILRRATLRDAPWGFAQKRQTLALVAANVGGWACHYARPGDCLLPVSIAVPGSRAPRPEERIAFSAAAGGILTDQSPADLIYRADIESPALYDAMFVQTLAWGLAAEIAPALSAAAGLAKMAANNYLQLMGRASAVHEGEEIMADIESSLISGRF